LRLLVFAVIFVFGIKGGVGAERLSEFFHRVRLDRQGIHLSRDRL
jgi:hypothetical protein